MEERDQILIERYLAGELTEAERHDVERRRAEDPLFHQEIIACQTAIEALRQKQRAELRQRFASRDEILDKKKPDPASQDKKRFIWLWLAAALVTALVIWRFLITNDQPTVSVETDSSEPIQINRPPIVPIDTVPLSDSLSHQQLTEKPKKANPDMAANSKKGQELFAEYFKPYKDAMMDPTTRGDEEMSPIQKYQKAYWDGEYPKALELFSQLTTEYQSKDNYRFSFANALLESGKTDQAISILEIIIKNKRSRYVVESYYALSLGHLKNGDKVKAVKYLEQYIVEEKATQKKQATEIIKILEY